MVVDLSFYHNVLKHSIDKIFMENQMKMEEVLDSINIVEGKTVHSISENELLLLLFHNSLLPRVSNTIKSSSELHLFDTFVCYLNDMFVKSKDTMEFIQVRSNEKIAIIDIARLANGNDIAINPHDISKCYSQDSESSIFTVEDTRAVGQICCLQLYLKLNQTDWPSFQSIVDAIEQYFPSKPVDSNVHNNNNNNDNGYCGFRIESFILFSDGEVAVDFSWLLDLQSQLFQLCNSTSFNKDKYKDKDKNKDKGVSFECVNYHTISAVQVAMTRSYLSSLEQHLFDALECW
ncbi:hypothetical protein RFI_21899 [Reticulomyxa filosa]|uniref:Uncharacterized protein n=1 Tax=Reticulomyxa filosa TaxID=46433 RepID=X6MQV6_RETFI|nr:hypothetical protein RFI_21899 [Reticulomyxa filosa]|eukprot:ETO15465.1 hypothetical protein RFI_21899 [Reticulomyxa filosa]